MLRKIFYSTIIYFLLQSTITAQTKLLFVGDDIPKQIYIQTHFIAENSDTLIFNHKILKRGTDYFLNKKFKRFELLFKHENLSDSLIVKYRLLPSWLNQKYGDALPEVTPLTKTTTIKLPTETKSQKQTESDMVLKGSKSFRFSTSKSGSSGFNQTLDLNLSGHLSENLTLKGTISDRGYNPSYGTSNSRLNELDKINLTVQSPNFMAQIGDIVVGGSNRREREKKISGLNLAVQNKNMRIGMIAARTKGQFSSFSFLGLLNKQGPYQIKSQGLRQAIIPGSETVWLDGVELKRGTNDDYTLDYPNGQITFNVNHLIDARSRVFIDFEPLSSEYKQEYLHANSNMFSSDSAYSFQFDWIREGDDKDENLSQIFSQEDEQLLANLTGEALIFKSGLLSDTLGNYGIIFDSLPDTVYRYVGENVGQYDVRFSFVDSGNGEYLYLGGNRYEYVGVDAGDYLPIIILHTPKRTDYLTSSFAINNIPIGKLQTEWSQSRKNKNLFTQDEITENKNFYRITYNNTSTSARYKLSVLYRKKEFGLAERNRINQADYIYQYYLPPLIQFSSDEQLVSTQADIKLHSTLSLKLGWNWLKYTDQFESKNSSLALKFSPMKKLSFTGDIHLVKTDLENNLNIKHGNSDNINIQFQYGFYKKYKFKTSYKKTERTNNYIDTLNGFVHDEYIIGIANNHSEISYTYYTEDTLQLTWNKKKDRKRIQFKSENKFRQLDYRLQIHYQETDDLSGEHSSLFTRVNFIYSNRKNNLQIQSSYMLSNETRFSKGIRYLEVNDGEGNFIFSDSQFIPQTGGNFILVEELLSDAAPVKRSEKSFSISKRWDKVYVTYNSVINEELFASESRSTNWVLPFYSDSKLSYLFFNRFAKGSLKAFPMSSGYYLTINFSEKKEKRFINQEDRLKQSLNTEVIFNQKVNQFFIEERFEYFKDERDAYYFREGDIDGFAVAGKLKQISSSNEYAVQLKFRSAVSANDRKSQMYLLLLENIIKIQKQGELRISSEFYRSNKNSLLTSESYLLTDNRPGTQGAIWSVIFRAKIKKEFRLNLTIQGRHSDINQARIFARTEFVAKF